jgi:hypothetical protein
MGSMACLVPKEKEAKASLVELDSRANLVIQAFRVCQVFPVRLESMDSQAYWENLEEED